MKVIVRIYKRHDMDLVALYKTPQYSLYKAIYNAMKSYVTGQTYLIKIPQNTIDMSKDNFKSHYQMIFNLNDTKDADIIQWLKGIKKGHRNIAIKSLIRGCLIGPTVFACETATNANLINAGYCNNLYDLLPSDTLKEFPLRKKKKNKSALATMDDKKAAIAKNKEQNEHIDTNMYTKRTDTFMQFNESQTNEPEITTATQANSSSAIVETEVETEVEDIFGMLNGFELSDNFDDSDNNVNNTNEANDEVFDMFADISAMLSQ